MLWKLADNVKYEEDCEVRSVGRGREWERAVGGGSGVGQRGAPPPPPPPSRAALPPRSLPAGVRLSRLPAGRDMSLPEGSRFASSIFNFLFGGANLFNFFPEFFQLFNKTRVKAPAGRNEPISRVSRPLEQRLTGPGCPPHPAEWGRRTDNRGGRQRRAAPPASRRSAVPCVPGCGAPGGRGPAGSS